MAGLFDTFTVARRGLTVQQSHINTSSHNIANVTTKGYSRQRAVAETTRPFGGQSRFDSLRVGQVGTGAEITSIQRIRDTFLDYQYRDANSAAESIAQQSEFFSRLESILGEPSSTSIQNQFSDLYSKLQELQKNPEIGSSARISTIRSAQVLAQSLNQAYTKIDTEMKDIQEEMLNDVVTVNNYLNQIRELNKKIVEVSASGLDPNDYMDSRDLLLDKLSSEFGIKVTQDKFNAINVKASDFQSPDNPIPNLINADPVDTNYVRFSYVKSATVNTNDNSVTLEYQPNGGNEVRTVKITTTDLDSANKIVDSLTSNRVLIGNSEGLLANVNGDEISPDDMKKAIFQINTTSNGAGTAILNSVPQSDGDELVGNNSRGNIAGKQQAQLIGKEYQKQLDVIAATLAYSMNAIQTGTMTNNGAAPDGNTYDLIFINKDASTANNKTDTGITAKNISINQALIDDPSKINASSTNISGDRNGDRAQAMADLLSTKFDLSNIENRDLSTLTREQFLTFTGNVFTDATNVKLTSNSNGITTANKYKNMVTNLGTQTKTMDNRVKLADSTVDFFTDSRESVSGVSIDDEMTDLIQFQHAYTANAKIISTIDELLDVVVNGLKR